MQPFPLSAMEIDLPAEGIDAWWRQGAGAGRWAPAPGCATGRRRARGARGGDWAPVA